ncbi:hypothetical protein KLO01_07290 [Knoellia locipacati]|uniref:Cell envelope-related transcriptional attenuator domain-containing protein n=1 Tax=Knoellia locipacati TaxID=882824 RepID=A0A512SXI5_9MICO|nr:hypothetical protein KLO01_07290 [Knoellia locipacati]
MTLEGGDAAMEAVLASVYAGRPAVEGSATVGTWKGEKVAVVTSSDDATLLVGAGSAWSVVGGWWPSLSKPAQLGTGPRHVLVIGSDARVGEPLKGTRGDTLQLVGIDTVGGAGVMGLPRDIWAEMPNGGHAKINAAFAFGGGKGQQQAVTGVTGIPIEGYVAVGFDGFEKIVDEAGGIPITVPKALRGAGGVGIIGAGAQVLTGAQALGYARERKTLPDGDFGRSRHQGDLILAAAIKARLEGVSSVPAHLTTVSRYADTNLTAAQALTWAAAFHKVDPTKVGRTVATGGFGWSKDRQSIVIPSAQSRAAFVRFRSGRL